MFWLFVVVLCVAMLVSPIALLIAFLPGGRDCPRCGTETIPIRMRMLHPLRRFLHQRWCMACGWYGMMRQTAWPRAVARVEAADNTSFEADDDAAWRGGKEA